MRHVLGEDVNVGLCLSWGPCWYHQKRYFEPKTGKKERPKMKPGTFKLLVVTPGK